MADTYTSVEASRAVPGTGERWAASSLLWCGRGGVGDDYTVISPVDGSVIQTVSLLSSSELEAVVRSDNARPSVTPDQLRSFCDRLHVALQSLTLDLEGAMLLETGFIRRDCAELMAGSLQYVHGFMALFESLGDVHDTPIVYETASGTRQIRRVSAPWGTVAAVLPQNAFLISALACLLNALLVGNRVILRAPLQSARSAALLALAIDAARPPAGTVSVVMARAREFVAAICHDPSPGLVHYMGSSEHAPSLLGQTFAAGKGVIVDGSGNGWVYVAPDANPDNAAAILADGAVRYNGQTCTSINGAMIDNSIYPAVRKRLLVIWGRLKCGNPLTDDVDVGPLFDRRQTNSCVEIVHNAGGAILCGGHCDGSLLAPTLVERPSPDSDMVRKGFFGNALWIMPGTADGFASLWRHNQYPLCAGILSPSATPLEWVGRLPNLARLTINGDPSIEHIYEPWGGYPSSGANPVSLWHEKYRRLVQVDEPAG
jgi:benzaldehyde dehydrogenase (NAD)